jgi:hypothetical protein
LEQSNRFSGQSFAAASEAKPVGRRRTDVDLACFAPKRAGKAAAHLFAVWRNLRLLPDKHDVRVDELKSGLTHLTVSLREQHERVCLAIALIVGREQGTDVRQPSRTEQRIGESMGNDVAVGMTDEPSRMINRHSTKHERHAHPESVRVHAEPDSHAIHAAEPI